MFKIKLDEKIVSEIEDVIHFLKNDLNEIHEVFKKRGKWDEDLKRYILSKSFFFDPESFIREKNKRLNLRITYILEMLSKLFPWVSTTLFDNVSFWLADYDQDERHGILDEKMIPYKNVVALIEICEKLRDQETIYELYKPVFVALSIIFRCCSNNKLSISKFQSIFLPGVLNAAISIAKRQGWISHRGKDTYYIRRRINFDILCPFCSQKISSEFEKCPNCDFYVPNIALMNKKSMDMVLPEKFYEFFDKKVRAYFIFDSFLLFESKLVGVDRNNIGRKIFTGLLIISYLEKLEEIKKIKKYPDIFFYAKQYLNKHKFGQTRLFYYIVEGKTHVEVTELLKEIVDKIIKNTEQEYEKETKDIPRRYLLYNKEEFRQYILSVIGKYFTPPLHEHPVSELEKAYSRICRSCGALMPIEAVYCGRCGAKL